MLEFDHLIIRVADLDAAGRDFRAKYGLDSAFGGRHAGLGTANRIVPLGRNYLELLAVVDEDEQAASRIPIPAAPALAGWMVRTDDIDAVASRLGLAVRPMARTRDDGTVLEWRLAGLEVMIAEPGLPAFIDWSLADSHHPVHMPVAHEAQPDGVAWLQVSGDVDRIKQWCDGLDVPIEIIDGPSCVRAAGVVVGGEEEVEFRYDPPADRS